MNAFSGKLHYVNGNPSYFFAIIRNCHRVTRRLRLKQVFDSMRLYYSFFLYLTNNTVFWHVDCYLQSTPSSLGCTMQSTPIRVEPDSFQVLPVFFSAFCTGLIIALMQDHLDFFFRGGGGEWIKYSSVFFGSKQESPLFSQARVLKQNNFRSFHEKDEKSGKRCEEAVRQNEVPSADTILP